MKGHTEIIQLLNTVLTNELTAINQYFLHARMLGNWGYKSLESHEYDESIDEMKHADEIIERILFLEGLPNLQRLDKLLIGETPREVFECDLQLELRAIGDLREGIALCERTGDFVSRDLLHRILVEEEAHVDWLETQLELMDKLGEERYLAQKLS